MNKARNFAGHLFFLIFNPFVQAFVQITYYIITQFNSLTFDGNFEPSEFSARIQQVNANLSLQLNSFSKNYIGGMYYFYSFGPR